ncbi:hypothetical protein Tco_0725451 [Tanacetum coccineum]|uniref:Retrotransposon gag domain-containing protein n=1 Tax=Tanacetum coccineum TaxID=301880 RepID=A0ABQ4YCY2_9ASTR
MIALEVGAAVVASPVEVLDLDTHSSLKADPLESPLPPVSIAPMVLPFMCSDDSESDTEMPERHVSPIPHDAMLTRWRSRVASRSSSPTNSTPEIPTAPILPAPYVVVAPFTDIISLIDAPPRICQRDIPIGRLYYTHPSEPCRALTARKSVRPLSSHCLALRYTSHHLDHFTSGSSSGHSSSDRSLSGHSISGHSLFRHTPPDTTVADSSAPPRIVYPPLARTSWCSEAYRCWMSALLSTMYPSTTSESSAEDSSFESSAGPSRKRCRSPAATMTSSIHATRASVPSRVDLLPPRKRFRDFISPEDSVKEDIDADVLADIEADAIAVEVTVDRDVVARVDAGIDMEVNVRVDVEDEVESSDRGTIEVRVDVVAEIDILDGMLIPDAMERLEQVKEVRGEEFNCWWRRASLLKQVASLERSNARLRGTMMMESARADRNGGNGNPNENNRGARPVARECTYQDFMKYQPLNFKRMEGVVGLIRWFEKIETVFHISNYLEKYQVKYATCTLLNNALTWWNSHKRTVGTEAAFAMSWRELMKLMAKVYCPRNEIPKMESKL